MYLPTPNKHTHSKNKITENNCTKTRQNLYPKLCNGPCTFTSFLYSVTCIIFNYLIIQTTAITGSCNNKGIYKRRNNNLFPFIINILFSF